MTSSPGSTSVRSATASAEKPPVVIATSAGSQARPVRRVSVSATTRCDSGSLSLYANQSLSRGSMLRWRAATYAGSGISWGLPTAKLDTSGSWLRREYGPVKNDMNAPMLWRMRSRWVGAVILMG